MGCFSWMFADTNNKKRLRIGHKGYILTPDNIFIPEQHYEGYGDFSDVDVYDCVVDWNRPFLTDIINKPLRTNPSKQMKTLAEFAEISDDEALRFVESEIKVGGFSPYFKTDWKRCLGIDIACYDEDNRELPFPIKIVSSKNCKYEDLPSSNLDPDQGF